MLRLGMDGAWCLSFWALALIPVFVVAGCDRLDSIGTTVEQAIPENGTTGPRELPIVSIAELDAAYEGNPVAWDSKYEGQRFRLEGVVRSIDVVTPLSEAFSNSLGVDADYYGQVTLVAEDEAGPYHYFPSEVHCTFDRNQRDEFTELQRRDIVTMTGVGVGRSRGTWGPTFSNC